MLLDSCFDLVELFLSLKHVLANGLHGITFDRRAICTPRSLHWNVHFPFRARIIVRWAWNELCHFFSNEFRVPVADQLLPTAGRTEDFLRKGVQFFFDFTGYLHQPSSFVTLIPSTV